MFSSTRGRFSCPTVRTRNSEVRCLDYVTTCTYVHKRLHLAKEISAAEGQALDHGDPDGIDFALGIKHPGCHIPWAHEAGSAQHRHTRRCAKRLPYRIVWREITGSGSCTDFSVLKISEANQKHCEMGSRLSVGGRNRDKPQSINLGTSSMPSLTRCPYLALTWHLGHAETCHLSRQHLGQHVMMQSWAFEGSASTMLPGFTSRWKTPAS